MDKKQDYLTIVETAKLLRVCDRTIRRQIKEGKLKAYKVGRSYRITQESIQEYLNNSTKRG